jgi:hypothetical protein
LAEVEAETEEKMARVQGEHYSIEESKLGAVLFAMPGDIPGIKGEDVTEFILADWPEGEEHQKWIDTAPAHEIAEWVTLGIYHGADVKSAGGY